MLISFIITLLMNNACIFLISLIHFFKKILLLFIRGISTHRGWIKKIRFGPGKGNMKILVLYNDGVDVWDVKDVRLAFFFPICV